MHNMENVIIVLSCREIFNLFSTLVSRLPFPLMNYFVTIKLFIDNL